MKTVKSMIGGRQNAQHFIYVPSDEMPARRKAKCEAFSGMLSNELPVNFVSGRHLKFANGRYSKKEETR